MCKSSHHNKNNSKSNIHRDQSEPQQKEDNEMDSKMVSGLPGQHFHMDFGFVRGSGYAIKQENAPTVTSINRYNSYLIIVDRVTRYIWIFLTSSKTPPITVAQKILKKFKSTNNHRTVRTDQGGKLGKSQDFQNMVANEGFKPEVMNQLRMR